MLYVFLPSHPAAAGIAAASLGLVLSANRIVRLAANSRGGLTALALGVAPWGLRVGPEASARAAGPVTRGSQGTLADLRRLAPRLLAPAYVFFVTRFAGSGVVVATLGIYLKMLAGEGGSG